MPLTQLIMSEVKSYTRIYIQRQYYKFDILKNIKFGKNGNTLSLVDDATKKNTELITRLKHDKIDLVLSRLSTGKHLRGVAINSICSQSSTLKNCAIK